MPLAWLTPQQMAVLYRPTLPLRLIVRPLIRWQRSRAERQAREDYAEEVRALERKQPPLSSTISNNVNADEGFGFPLPDPISCKISVSHPNRSLGSSVNLPFWILLVTLGILDVPLR